MGARGHSEAAILDRLISRWVPDCIDYYTENLRVDLLIPEYGLLIEAKTVSRWRETEGIREGRGQIDKYFGKLRERGMAEGIWQGVVTDGTHWLVCRYRDGVADGEWEERSEDDAGELFMPTGVVPDWSKWDWMMSAVYAQWDNGPAAICKGISGEKRCLTYDDRPVPVDDMVGSREFLEKHPGRCLQCKACNRRRRKIEKKRPPGERRKYEKHT